jgi:hypothetical protein
VRTNVQTLLLNTINILIINEYRYRTRLGKIVWVLNMSSSQKATFAAEARLAEGQFLTEEQALNKATSLIYGAMTNSFQNRRTEFRTKVNLNKEQNVNVIPPLT